MNNLTKVDSLFNKFDSKKSIPYYPLPSNEGYEKFLQTQKKELCKIVCKNRL